MTHLEDFKFSWSLGVLEEVSIFWDFGAYLGPLGDPEGYDSHHHDAWDVFFSKKNRWNRYWFLLH